MTFTVKGFKVICYCSKASNMETRVNKECDHCMEEMFKTCGNAYKLFYHIVLLEICKSYNIVPKGLYMKKDYCIGNPSTEFCNSWRKEKLDYQLRLWDMLIQGNVRKLSKLEDDFGEVIRKTKVNLKFLFRLRFHLDRVEKKQQKIKLKKLRSLSPNSMYKKLLTERFYEHLPHFRFKFDFVKFCNSKIEDFENLLNSLTLDNMPGFIEKSKIPFNSLKNLLANRYLDAKNNEREEVNSVCDFTSDELSEDNSNDSEVV